MRIGKIFYPSLLALVLPGIARTQALVTAEWIEQHRNDSELVIVDARPEEEYAKGHIPGAIHLNTYDYLVDSSQQGEKVFHEWLVQTFGAAGLGPTNTVIVYENKLGMRAARAFWMLWYAGQPKVGMLQGGLEAWRAKQLPMTTNAPPPRTPTKYRLKPQKKWIASAQEVASLAKDRKTVILDVRRREEYEGKGGSTDCARQGHIPGAIWVEWTQFLAPDGVSLQAPEKLGVLLAEKGITPDKQIVTYCHRGARAALVWAALDEMGYPKVKNYIGSWHDWAARKELPTE